MNGTIRVMLLGAMVAAGAIGCKRDGASDSRLHVSGNIEVTDAQVSFKIAGRVDARLVDEGETVSAGQTVAILDSRDLAQQVALREAELAAARAALSELEAGSRPEEIGQAKAAAKASEAKLAELKAGARPQEIAAQAAVVAQAQAELDRRKVEFDRLSTLKAQNRAADIEFEVGKAAYDAAKAVLAQVQERLSLIKAGTRQEVIQQAEADLAGAQQKLAMVEAGPRKEDIAQAKAKVAQAEAARDLARTQLGYATLASPLTGVVMSKNIEPGEYVAPGTPVITVGDLASVWLRAYVNETDLGRVKLNQNVRVTIDAYPGKVYPGRVAFISQQAEFTPKTVQTDKERVKLVYRVKIDLDNAAMELKPGMPADADILLDQFAPAPVHPPTTQAAP
ncbi:MAG: efflux RND transporter periplasmic adaptor subunit [Phycisphaerae bacterium]|nr:efflux RND transporter periplasmic adaptor subunit [Phycisphaerae bacterium]